MAASITVRAPSRLRRWVFAFFVGFVLAWLPFFLSFLDPLTYLIPMSLKSELEPTTALLFGLLTLVFREREHLGPASLKVLRGWALLGIVGLALLFVFQIRFIVRVPHYNSSALASEIVASSRRATCPCRAAVSNQECLRERNLDPMFMARCWDDSRRTLNQTVWTLAYLMTIGGAASFVGLLWLRPGKARPAEADIIRPRGESDGRSLFLSYSRVDREFAERLAEDLKASGITVWWDRWDVEVGDSLPGTIESAIAQSACFGIVLSPDSVASPWVRTELELALTLEIEGRVKVLPILYRPCEIPLSLRRKAWADFTSSPEEGLASLLRSL